MAIRNLRYQGDEILKKKSREILNEDIAEEKIQTLIDDMIDTMHKYNGVGLAAVQVGVLKRIVVIDVAGEDEEPQPLVLINPEIIERSGEQTGEEACLSLPGVFGIVTRPNVVKVRFFDENMEQYELEGEELLARAICHECDHLDGVLYRDVANGPLQNAAEREAE